MKGEIEKIWKNTTPDGRRYDVLQIGGVRYSVWDEGYLDKLKEGQTLEFDMRESGDYKNICKIYDPAGANNPGESNALPPETPANGNARNQKSRQIVRMSCLRSASQILGGSRIPAGERADKTIEMAKKFEKYIGFDDLGGPDGDD